MESKQITNMWNRSSKLYIYIYILLYKTEALHVKQEIESEKLGLGFLGKIMHMHKQACMCR